MELAYKDAVKKNILYDRAITLLMGLYYFYRNSPKQRSKLREMFQELGMKSVVPTRVGGTRWVGHMVLAINTFLKCHPALVRQLNYVLADPKNPVSK